MGGTNKNWTDSGILWCLYKLMVGPDPIGGFQPISRDTDDNGEMYKCWWTNKRANERSIVFVHQHGGDDVT